MAAIGTVSTLCTNSVYAPILSLYSTNSSVRQYCTSKYPVAAATTTATASPVTSSVTSVKSFPAPTVTVTATSVVTLTAPPTTITTSASLVTSFITATTTSQEINTVTEFTCPSAPNKLKVRRAPAPPKSLCPAGTGSKYSTKGGDAFELCKKFDAVGGDLHTLSAVRSANACADACSLRSGCVGAVYQSRSQKCWLKRRMGTAKKCDGTTIIYRMHRSPPATTTSRKSTSCSTTSSRTTTTSSRPTSSSSSATTTTAKTTTSSQTPFQPDATFCSCIQSTPTSTVTETPTITATIISSSTASPDITITVTSQSITITTSSSTETITPTTTLTVSTSTSTITVSSTTTSTTSIYPTTGPGELRPQPDSCKCGYTVRCGVKLDPSVERDNFVAVGSSEACLQYCDELSTCVTAVAAFRSDGFLICNIYDTAGFDTATGAGLVQESTATLFARGGTGSCTNLGGQCCKPDAVSLIDVGTCFQ